MKTLKATMEGAYEKAREHLKATAVRFVQQTGAWAGVSGREIDVAEQPDGAEGEIKKSCTAHGLGLSILHPGHGSASLKTE